MSNVVDIRTRMASNTTGAIGRWVRSFLPEASPRDALARDRAALELRHWVARTTNDHGAATTLELLQFQIERVKAQGEANG